MPAIYIHKYTFYEYTIQKKELIYQSLNEAPIITKRFVHLS